MFPEWYDDYYLYDDFRFMPMPAPMPGPMATPTPTPTQKPQTTQTPANFQSNFNIAPGAPTTLGIEYTQGYLKTQIGKRVKVTFLLGTGTIQDRDGVLVEVGISYLVLRDLQSGYLIMGDLYSVKFVNIYDEGQA